MLITKPCAYSQGALVLEVLVQEEPSALTDEGHALTSEGCLTTSEYGTVVTDIHALLYLPDTVMNIHIEARKNNYI